MYVRQEDIFFSQLTVRETLMTAARLQLPNTLTEEEKQERVDALLRLMGLVRGRERMGGRRERMSK